MTSDFVGANSFSHSNNPTIDMNAPAMAYQNATSNIPMINNNINITVPQSKVDINVDSSALENAFSAIASSTFDYKQENNIDDLYGFQLSR